MSARNGVAAKPTFREFKISNSSLAVYVRTNRDGYVTDGSARFVLFHFNRWPIVNVRNALYRECSENFQFVELDPFRHTQRDTGNDNAETQRPETQVTR
jgi:hypothetical protein